MLFVGRDGCVSEGSTWNVGFVDQDGTVVWPRADVLPGVTMDAEGVPEADGDGLGLVAAVPPAIHLLAPRGAEPLVAAGGDRQRLAAEDVRAAAYPPGHVSTVRPGPGAGRRLPGARASAVTPPARAPEPVGFPGFYRVRRRCQPSAPRARMGV